MANIIQRSMRRILQKVLNWDLYKKSQLILCYAIFLEIGLFLIQINYLDHPLVNQKLLYDLRWFIPIVILIDIVLIGLGNLIKTNYRHQIMYSRVALSFYFACLLYLHFLVGLLNLTNGVIFVGTILVCLLLFPNKVTQKIIWLYAISYVVLVILTVAGYIDYALAFSTNALIHPKLEGVYVTFSILYSILYSAIILSVGSLLIDAWKEKIMHRNIECYKDELTTLLNDIGIKRIAALQLSQAYISSSELSVVILDVDNLRRLNDEYDRQTGDYALKHIGSVLRKNLRNSDMVARVEGGTFVLILAFTPLEKAQAVAEMCRLAIEQSACILENGKKLQTKASFGVSSTLDDDFDFDGLLRSARRAMRCAKHNGKNQVCSSAMLTN